MSETGSLSNLEDIQERHRQEKKQLQTQITTLKKGINNDKKKKKEITGQIAQMELEMKNRHDNELFALQPKPASNHENLQMNGLSIGENSGIEFNYTIHEQSKAQKKRDKKIAKAREAREKAEAESADAYLTSERHREHLKFEEIMKSNGLKLIDIPSDGDCMYAAIEHQLSIRNEQLPVKELRKLCSQQLREHKYDFLPFMTSKHDDEIMSDVEFEKYCDDIEKTSCWGGNVELQALSQRLKLPIKVIQADGPAVEIGLDQFPQDPLLLSYHKHAFNLGAHYNSVIKA